MMRLTAGRRVRVPASLRALTRIDHGAETPPRALGLDPARVAAVWTACEALYRSGLHPAITLVVRREGRVVLKRSIGAISGTAPGERGPLRTLSPDTPLCLFSASKSITALLVHKLAEDGRLDLDDPVADYLPEFGAHGKHRVTIRQLLAHRAGIPSVPDVKPHPQLLHDWDGIVRQLCAARPLDPRFRTQAYHALTCGFVVGELVRRVSGLELNPALRQWFAEPLGCEHLRYGVAPEWRAQVPRSVHTGPRPAWWLSAYVRRAIGLPFAEAVAASNHPAFQTAVVPAGNIYATADEVSRVFQMLLDGGVFGGVRVLRPKTIAEALRPLSALRLDRTLLVPLRFSAGFMLGENPFGLFGPRCREAFGHLGFVSVLCWADPRRRISVALLNNGKSVAADGALRLAQVLTAIARAFPPP